MTDRYEALGMPLPDPETMCKGPCEGTGWVPVKKDDPDEAYALSWQAAEEKSPSDDGWHFVRCFDCRGTGMRDHKIIDQAADFVDGKWVVKSYDEK